MKCLDNRRLLLSEILSRYCPLPFSSLLNKIFSNSFTHCHSLHPRVIVALVFSSSLITNFDMLTSANEAEGFARIFPSSSTLDSSGVSLPDFLIRNESLLSDLHITLFMVSASISKQDGHRSTAPKKCARERAPFISNLPLQ